MLWEVMSSTREDQKYNPGQSHRAWSLLVMGAENTSLWKVSKPGSHQSVLPKIF